MGINYDRHTLTEKILWCVFKKKSVMWQAQKNTTGGVSQGIWIDTKKVFFFWSFYYNQQALIINIIFDILFLTGSPRYGHTPETGIKDVFDPHVLGVKTETK